MSNTCLEIPIRHSMRNIFDGVVGGTIQPQGMLEDERLGIIPHCINMGWTVVEMADRLGWSRAEVQRVIREYFLERQESVYDECSIPRVAAETKVFGEMLRSMAIQEKQYKVAWYIHRGMIDALMDIGIIPKAPKEVLKKVEHTKTVYKVEVSQDGFTKVTKHDEDDIQDAEFVEVSDNRVEVEPYPPGEPTDDDEVEDLDIEDDEYSIDDDD